MLKDLNWWPNSGWLTGRDSGSGGGTFGQSRSGTVYQDSKRGVELREIQKKGTHKHTRSNQERETLDVIKMTTSEHWEDVRHGNSSMLYKNSFFYTYC